MTEPFTGLYSHAIRDLVQSLQPHQFQLFALLASYANPNGICWPGVRDLRRWLGWQNERILYELENLRKLGLIRTVRRQSRDEITGQYLAAVYQVNPRILLVKNPVLGLNSTTEQASSNFSSQTQNRPVLDLSEEPRTQPESYPDENQNQEPESRTNTTNQNFSSNGDWPEPPTLADVWIQTGQGKYAPDANTNPAPARPSPAVANHESHTAPGSAAPQDWGDAQQFALPLAGEQENLAHELKTMAPTQLWSARRLVHTYGEEQVRKGLRMLAAAKQKGTVYNPAGLLTTWLANGAVKAEPERPASPYTSGPYADFIES